jgi:hypothetical protein
MDPTIIRSAPEQVEALQSRIADANPSAPEDPKTPMSILATPYELDGDQERGLVDHCLKRLRELEDDMGATDALDYSFGALGEEQPRYPLDSFLGRRERYSLLFQNKVAWRVGDMGGIFANSNLVVPAVRRVCRQMVARGNNYFFSTDPWFAAYPEGKLDEELSALVDAHAKWKFERCGIKQVLEQAVETAFVRNEAVVKTAHRIERQLYRTLAKVLVNQEGKLILTTQGDYIFEEDEWAEIEQPAPAALPSEAEGAMVPPVEPAAPTVIRVLVKDPSIVMPDTPLFVERLIDREVTTFSGPKPTILPLGDFLAPLTAPDLQSADILVHKYELSALELADSIRRPSAIGAVGVNALEDTKRLVELIQEATHATTQPKTDMRAPGPGETADFATGQETGNPTIVVAECYLRYDANGDGILEEIVALVAVESQRLIWADYLANVTPDAQRPFAVVRVGAPDNRWYGIGAMEVFASSQKFIDLCINRINFSQSTAGRVTFWNPRATLEGIRDPDLVLHDGGTYTPVEGKKPEDILSYVTLPEVEIDSLKFLMEFYLQLVQLESGVINAGDQAVSGMPAGNLATGIRNIEKSGQELFALFLAKLEPGITPIINRCVLLLYRHLDAEETFRWGEGETDQLMRITPERVRNLHLDVQLLLTRYRAEQQLASAMEATNLVERFYAYPPLIQMKVATFFRTMLRALQVKNADEIIQPMPDPGAMPTQPGMPPAAGGGGGTITPGMAGTGAGPVGAPITPDEAMRALARRPAGVSSALL